MKHIFESLLRSNFRCGRMLNSRMMDQAGRFRAPIFP
ncbi:MAG: hypothetical protein H6Q61_1291 [Firmicutes bacterium]|nr:hypothetical protein [Bacillota bacterium]